jgi:hypothetical protein
MTEILLTFEHLRVILKWYFKFENVCEVYRGKKVKQSHYRPGVAQRVPGS